VFASFRMASIMRRQTGASAARQHTARRSQGVAVYGETRTTQHGALRRRLPYGSGTRRALGPEAGPRACVSGGGPAGNPFRCVDRLPASGRCSPEAMICRCRLTTQPTARSCGDNCARLYDIPKPAKPLTREHVWALQPLRAPTRVKAVKRATFAGTTPCH